MHPKVVAVVQARMGSTRLPGKVLERIGDWPMLEWVVERLRLAQGLAEVLVATSVEATDDPIATVCQDRGCLCFRGSERDLMDRFYRAAEWREADQVVRVTADCPFVDYQQVDCVVERHIASRADFSHNVTVWGSGMPWGTGVEIVAFNSLEEVWSEDQPCRADHGGDYINEHTDRFHVERLEAPPGLRRPDLRLTVDMSEDLHFVREVHDRLGKPGAGLPLGEVIGLLDAQPDLQAINSRVRQRHFDSHI